MSGAIKSTELALKKAFFRIIEKILDNSSPSSSRSIFNLFSKYVLKDNQIHSFPSIIHTKDDYKTTPELVQILSDSSKLASQRILSCGKKNLPDSKYLNVYPGEHYRLLNAIVETLNVKNIVEIGTYTGMGSLSLKEGFKDVVVTTYDVVKWDQIDLTSHIDSKAYEHFEWDQLDETSHFESKDFDDSLKQVIGDLSDDQFFERNLGILNDADLIFMDAPKDNVFEYKMAKQFKKLKNKNKKILIIDDILFVNMIDFWRNIKSPKLDASSLGHWSGTGIVDISDGFLYD